MPKGGGPRDASANTDLTAHRAHDYAHLVRRWRELAARAGLRLKTLTRSDGQPVHFLRSPALATQGGIYLSAGIHGDEPASTEALFTWAEMHAAGLAELPLLILPCLNPWGLTNNQRANATGLDLNRSFHRTDQPVITALKELVAPYHFSLALMLHEDFDAQGLYLYEIKRDLPFWGEDLLKTARAHMPIDPRGRIDGRTAAAGLIRRRFDRRRFEQIGYPEAIWLHEAHARRALTIETPSEFALDQRVRTHVAVIEECVRRALAGRGN
jgi:protein MpaA